MSGFVGRQNGLVVLKAALGEAALPDSAHAGLVFDRFLRLWEGPKLVASEGRRTVLQKFCDEFEARCGRDQHEDRLRELHARLAGWHARRSDLVERRIETSWRLVIGLGAEHPLENGFLFDRVAGVPVIPGSSLKGAARAFAKMEGYDDSEIAQLFGGEAASPAAGDVLFEDALPSRWPRLAVDVINCHHPDYYADEQRTRDPVELESPVPVYFLTVEEGTEFVFRLASRSLDAGRAERAMAILSSALATIGVGGKTAVGYGFFVAEAVEAQPTPAISQEARAALEDFRAFFGDGATFVTADKRKKHEVQTELVQRLRDLITSYPAVGNDARRIVSAVLDTRVKRSRALNELLRP